MSGSDREAANTSNLYRISSYPFLTNLLSQFVTIMRSNKLCDNVCAQQLCYAML